MELESTSFLVTCVDFDSPDGLVDYHYESEPGKVDYLWAVGRAGELTVYRKTYHAVFTQTVVKDERVHCYAPGVWAYVTKIPQQEAKPELTVVGAENVDKKRSKKEK